MTIEQAVRPIKDNADGTLTICANCKHYTYSSGGWISQIGELPDTCRAAPDKINFINGAVSFKPCVEVNTDGHCPLFVERPKQEPAVHPALSNVPHQRFLARMLSRALPR